MGEEEINGVIVFLMILLGSTCLITFVEKDKKCNTNSSTVLHTTLKIIPSLVYMFHPVTLYFLLLKDNSIICIRFLENIAIIIAIATTENVLKSSNRISKMISTLCVIMSAVALIKSSPLQGSCLAFGIVSQFFFSHTNSRVLRQEEKGKTLNASSYGEKMLDYSTYRLLFWFLSSSITFIFLFIRNTNWLEFDSETLQSLHLRAESTEPEMSPSWYLFSEIFLRQLPYFTVSIWFFPFLYSLPMTFRLYECPRISLTAIASLAALFDPSGAHTLARLPLSTALFLSCPNEVAQMRAPYFWFWLQFFSLAVSPAMKSFWLNEGYGNANFMFNQHLIFALAGGALTADFVAGSFRLQRLQKNNNNIVVKS